MCFSKLINHDLSDREMVSVSVSRNCFIALKSRKIHLFVDSNSHRFTDSKHTIA